MNPKVFWFSMFLVVFAAGVYLSWDSLAEVWDMASVVMPAGESPPSTPAAPAAPVALTGFAKKFQDKLFIMDGGTPRNLDTHKLAGVKYWAFYYSASWCPPCRAFTPELVNFYRGFKPSHPDFELVFMSCDNSDADMISYMTGDAMPWPGVWYDASKDPSFEARKYCGNGIPCLVLVDNNGSVLSDTYRWGMYQGPRNVVADIEQMVK